jgi:molybdate transport system substrate-binding protein
MKRILLLVALLLVGAARGDEISVAVAANFAAPMKRIAAQFEKQTGHKVLLSMGATGNFYAQIRNGAPFEVLLAADQDTPVRLIAQGHAVAQSRFTYAVGRLVLWSPRPGLVDDQGKILREGRLGRIAYGNPQLAPYGAAAVQTMQSLGLFDALQPRLVQGENIAQAYQFVVSGNADAGFVALSQVLEDGKLREGSAWMVPANLYAPIRQDAVLLNPGKDHAAAAELLRYLQSDAARAVIRACGYEL